MLSDSIPLDTSFVEGAQREPVSVLYGNWEVTFRQTTAATNAHGAHNPVLEVASNGKVIGYITPYSGREFGAIAAHLLGGMPHIVPTVEDALREIVNP